MPGFTALSHGCDRAVTASGVRPATLRSVLTTSRTIPLIALCGALSLGVAACGDDDTAASGGAQDLSGSIRIDGSSTVAPLSEAAAELFNEENPDVRVSVGTSGTGGGFEKFCRGETDISDASRAIEKDEIEACEKQGIQFQELTVANDALSVIVNPENAWAQCLTVDELNRIWDKGSDVQNWSQVRSGFPNEELELFGPGTDSGTFDYFTEAVNGEEGVQRTRYNNVGEDDNATITGVSGNKGAMGYLGFSFLQENQDKVKALQIRNDDGQCVEPTAENVQNGTYTPLGRELFVYASDKALEKPAVRAFLDFYIENAQAIAEQTGFIGLTEEQKREAQQAVQELSAGGSPGGATTTP
jgi:phosphate transport system substrate-binding protein